MSSDVSKSPKNILVILKSIIFSLMAYAILLISRVDLGVWTMVVPAAVFILVIFLSKANKGGEGSRGGSGFANRAGKTMIGLVKTIIILAIIFAAIWYLSAPFNESIPKPADGPLNSVLYTVSQDGAGIVVNNGTYGIQLATGAAKTGTTFKLRTKESVVGWPSFGADIFASKGNATMKVSYVDADIPSASVHFKEILIPTKHGVRYSNKYKLDNYRAKVVKEGKEAEIDNSRLAFRKDPPNHDIELEVYVAPNSYVELSNMAIIRNW